MVSPSSLASKVTVDVISPARHRFVGAEDGVLAALAEGLPDLATAIDNYVYEIGWCKTTFGQAFYCWKKFSGLVELVMRVEDSVNGEHGI